MRSGVDASRHSADNDYSGPSECSGNRARSAKSVCGWIAGADDGNEGPLEHREVTDRKDRIRNDVELFEWGGKFWRSRSDGAYPLRIHFNCGQLRQCYHSLCNF
jgi:hypothetical protein